MADDDEDEPERKNYENMMEGAKVLKEARYFLPVPKSPDYILKGDEWRIKFDDAKKDEFCELLAKSGRIYAAAAAVGFNTRTIKLHRKTYPDFDEEVNEALAAYADRVRSQVARLGVEGVLEPMTGRVGKDKDGVIAYRRVWNTRMLELEAKRVDPAYRDSNRMPGSGGDDENGGRSKGGILVVYPTMQDAEWEEATEGEILTRNPLEGLEGADIVNKPLPRGRMIGGKKDDEGDT